MKVARFLLCLALGTLAGRAAAVWQPQPGHPQIPLWPKTSSDGPKNQAPETMETADSKVAGRPFIVISNVSQPTMTVYSPKAGNTGVAVVVFPGGGYQVLAVDLEGTEVCDWLTSRGITCVLLKYRVPDSGPHWEDSCKCHVTPKAPLALEDAQRALGLLRLHALEWHVDPHKIGVLGFSAGGHLVAAMSTHFDKRTYPALDAADRESCRPDFAVALYPGHLWMQDEKRFALNPDIHVTAKTPPTFLLQAENDNVDNVNQALVYDIALKDAHVPAEMHLYAEGGHAFGLRRTKHPITEWPNLVEKWLGTIGVLPVRN